MADPEGGEPTRGGPRFRWRKAVETSLLVAICFSYSGALDAEGGRQLGFDSPYTALFLCALLAVRFRRSAASALRRAWPVLLPVAIAPLSAAWSLNPAWSLRQSASLWVTTAVGLYLAERVPVGRQLRLLAAALALAGIGSFFAICFRPETGLMHGLHEGAWQGLYDNRNHLAPSMALLVLACTFALLEARGQLPWAWLALSPALILMLGSRSRAALLSLCILIPVVLGVHAWPRLAPTRRRIASVCGMAVLAVGALALATLGRELLEFIGRDFTFSDRTRIWSMLLDYAAAEPLLGHGYAAFWIDPDVRAVAVARLDFFPFHAHNGFLDLQLELGALGLASFAVPFALVARRAARRALAGRGILEAWPAVYLLFFVLVNLPESWLLREGALYWLLYVAAAAAPADGRRPPRRDAEDLPRQPGD